MTRSCLEQSVENSSKKKYKNQTVSLKKPQILHLSCASVAHVKVKDTVFYRHDLVLECLKVSQSFYLEKSPLPNRAERSGASGCFSFFAPVS